MSAKWKCGRKLPGRLGVVVRVSRLPVNRLVYNYGQNDLIIYQPNFMPVIQNKKNLIRYIEILEQNWKLSIAEIREFYAQDKLNPPSNAELMDFQESYIAKRKGKTVEELFSKEAQRESLAALFEGNK